ncbi:hypothetical protein SK128_010262 [Halocaridina rubra]|uniref:Uncharacterized protein n=1 Tax=Halocaridina rubra TaxID=373956 RepID=A0AAN8WAG9_HALRR
MFERVNGVFGCRTCSVFGNHVPRSHVRCSTTKYPVHTFEHHFKDLSVEPRSTNRLTVHVFRSIHHCWSNSFLINLPFYAYTGCRTLNVFDNQIPRSHVGTSLQTLVCRTTFDEPFDRMD